MMLVVVLAFSSCEKEGVFNPKRKISKITTTTTYEAAHIEPDSHSETWNWGKKTLESIEFGNGNILKFEYDKKNRISKSYYANEANVVLNYSYDGNELSKIELHGAGKVWLKMEFEYSKSKISKITYTEYNFNEESNQKQMRALSLFIPQHVCENIERFHKTAVQKNSSKATDDYILTIELTWENGNISKEVYIEDGGDSSTCTYKYDNNKNPFRGYEIGDLNLTTSLSENNVTSYFYTIEQEGNGPEYTYTYSYDKGWPTEKIEKKSNYTTTTRYEYKN